MKPFGIDDKVWQQILDVCFGFSTVHRVLVYGSRARGDYREGSDIDLAIDAPQMNSQVFAQLWNALDDLPIIFKLDVVHLQALKNKDLLEAIQRDEMVFSR